MTQINTVRGSIDVDSLGTTLMHEHIIVCDREIEENVVLLWDEDSDVQRAVTLLNEAKAAGIDTLVDLTVLGLGRDIPLISRIAEQVDINVIVATGVYTFDNLPRYFASRGPGTVNGGKERMTDLFIGDIENGIGKTGVRAGILKCATDRLGVTPGVEQVLRATARAHRATGVPISTHSDPLTFTGRDQLRIFAEEGVDLSRVTIGHCGDTTDTGYLKELLKSGCYIGMDRFGIEPILDTAQRVQTVVQMCREGFANRMVLSHDTNCYSQAFDPEVRRDRFPNWSFTFVVTTVLPLLLESGLSEGDIHQMMVLNPREIFSKAGSY